MAIVVQKYGGSSVADVDKLRRIASGVVERHRSGDHVVVVVSAMGRTTDELIAKAREVSLEPSQRELDMLVTAGERISMALLSMAIHEAGGDSISFTGSQSGIITEDNHQGARILEVRPSRVVEELDRGRIVIVAGYQGVSRTTKEITTLGRGGTDTTAVALAAALGADACEIYSDVDGVYSGDPDVCPQARLLPRLSYETMQAIACAGARVLNADAVDFARRAGIVIEARKSGDGSGRRTIVSAVPGGERATVIAVVVADAVSHLHGEGVEIASLVGRIHEVAGRPMILSALSRIDLLVDRTSMAGKSHAPLARIATACGLEAHEVGVITLIGTGILSQPRVVALIEASATKRLGWFAERHGLSLVVAPDACGDTARTLHDELIPAP